MVGISTLGGVNEYTPRHLKIRPHAEGHDVVCCLRCGQSAVVAMDELHDFVDEHTNCPETAA